MNASSPVRHGAHAVVIGASMGGLVAAAALAPFYDRVTVVDRDELPDVPRPRRGVPQGRHAHGIQPGGLRALDTLLPGLVDELVAAGAPAGDITGRSGWFLGGGQLARSTSGTDGIGLTRPFLEHHVRERVAALPGVTVRDRTEVSGPVAAGPRVVGVGIVDGEPVAADLVVDATGRVSALPRWLADLGFPAPAEDVVHCRMAYLTRRWRLVNDVMGDDVVQVVAPAATPRFGVVIAQEDGTHIVTLGGLLGDGPTRDDDAYRAFAATLPCSRIADALVGAEPVTELQPSHFPFSRRRRYDALRAFPAGLLAIGDAIASFNPMYGQGMSVAALQAVALRDMLAAGRLDTRRFFRTAHRIEDVAWKIAAGGDLRFDDVAGHRTPDMKLMNRYLDRLTAAARTDAVLADRFLRVAGFLARPETLFAPSVLWRVLRARPAAPAPVARSVEAVAR